MNLVKAFKMADADRSGTMDRNEFLALLKDAGLRVDVDRATGARRRQDRKCPAPRARPSRARPTRPSPSSWPAARRRYQRDDALLSIGEKITSARGGPFEEATTTCDLATLPATMLKHKGEWRVRRTTAKYLSKREADALMRCARLADDATLLETCIVSFASLTTRRRARSRVAVAMDAAARCLRGKRRTTDARLRRARSLGTTATHRNDETRVVSVSRGPGFAGARLRFGRPPDRRGVARRFMPRQAHLEYGVALRRGPATASSRRTSSLVECFHSADALRRGFEEQPRASRLPLAVGDLTPGHGGSSRLWMKTATAASGLS